MHVIHIQIHVKPEFVEAFKTATVANARESVKEPGIARFDFVQQQEDPTRFALVEAYRSLEANAAHKETQHYKTWSETVTPMMAEQRTRVMFTSVFPEDKGW